MYAKVTTSLAALIVIVPAVVMTTPASEAAEPTRARAKPTTMAKPSRAMVQRQRFNQIVHQKPAVTNQPTMQHTFGKDPSLPKPNRPLGKVKPDPNAPVTPKMTAQEQLDLAKRQGMSPKIISVLENKARMEREAAATLPGNKPDNGTADDRPKHKVIIVMPGQDDAPGVAEPAPRYYAPRYQAQPQPQVQPQRVVAKDDPTCVQGT